MADPSFRAPKVPPAATSKADRDRFPSDAELLHELRKHGAKPPPPRELPLMSRRTRDYLIVAGLGSAVIGFVTFRLVGGAEAATALRLALTGVALYCGLLWFIFYGVMSRY